MIAGALLLAAAAATPAGADPAIAFALNSWGHRIVQWTIRPDGRITYGRVEGASLFGPMTTTSTPPSPARYRWVANLLAPGRGWAGRDLPCRTVMTDAPYGEVRWGGGPPLAFNAGCRPLAASGRKVVAAIQAADGQVAAWAKGDVRR